RWRLPVSLSDLSDLAATRWTLCLGSPCLRYLCLGCWRSRLCWSMSLVSSSLPAMRRFLILRARPGLPEAERSLPGAQRSHPTCPGYCEQFSPGTARFLPDHQRSQVDADGRCPTLASCSLTPGIAADF